MEKKLNIGAGKAKIPGFINIDIDEKADVQVDLNTEKLPFEDNSVDVVFTSHTLEHIDNYIFALGEIHRVLKHGGRLLMGVSYLTLTKYNLVNPYHKQHFNEYSFDFFDSNALKGSAVEGNPIEFKKMFHNIKHIGIFSKLPSKLQSIARNHLLNVASTIDFGLIAVKEGKELTLPDGIELEMQESFNKCLNSREKY